MARINIDGELLTGSLTNAHTINTSVEAKLIEIMLTNTDTSARQAEVQFIATGQSAASKYKVIAMTGGVNIPAGVTQIYRFNQFLKTGDKINWKADVNAKIMAKLSVLEVAVEAGKTRVNLDGILLPNTFPGSPPHTVGDQTTLIELVLCNTDTVERTIDFHGVPSAGSETNANRLIGYQAGQGIAPGETQIWRFNQFFDVNDFFQWQADVAAKVAAKLSIFEEAA